MNARIFFASLLFLSSCQDEDRIFLAENINLSGEDVVGNEIGQDFDLDGDIDNQLPNWVNAWNFIGFDPQEKFSSLLQRGDLSVGFELTITDGSSDGASLQAFQATPQPRSFDGTDLLTPSGEVFSFEGEAFKDLGLFDAFNSFKVRGDRFSWPLIPFDSGELLTLPLLNVTIEGFIEEQKGAPPQLRGVVLSGLIPAADVAAVLEEMPAAFDDLLIKEASQFTGEPLPCQTIGGLSPECAAFSNGLCTDTNEDGVSTGFCVSSDSTTALALSVGLDTDGDGHYVVDFDEQNNVFLRNDLNLLFDLESATAQPTGLFGTFFTIDTDGDGNLDAMPVSLSFNAISAILQP